MPPPALPIASVTTDSTHNNNTIICAIQSNGSNIGHDDLPPPDLAITSDTSETNIKIVKSQTRSKDADTELSSHNS